MKIVVDTNIIFSAILNKSGKIGDLLMNSDDALQLYTPLFIHEELKAHRSKLESLSKLNYEDIESIKSLLFNHITFINMAIVPISVLQYAEIVMANIDPDDTEFFALAEYLDCFVWTGDKKMHQKLLLKNIKRTILTNELWALRHTIRE